MDSENLRSVRFIRRFLPVTSADEGTKMTVLDGGKRALTPLAVVTIAVLFADIVFTA